MHRCLPRARILFGLSLLFSACTGPDSPLQLQSEQFFLLPLDGSLTIENTDGAIYVFGWSEPRVRVASLRQAYSATRLRQIRVETQTGPASLAVRTIVPPAAGLFSDRSGTVAYTINAPETAQLKLKLVNGEINLQGLRGGRARVELVNGRILALNCYAQVEARSTHGVIEVFYEWWENLPAAIECFLQHGRIGARLPASACFRVEASTAQGRIGNKFGFNAMPAIGPGQKLKGATASHPLVSLGLRTGGGNISIDSLR
jgi:hypothetical protein